MSLKIGEVAVLARVSVRTLRHYDEIELLSPSGRSGAGYRLYSQADLQRLQLVLFYRTLNFPLAKIHLLMSDPTFKRKDALLHQRKLISEKTEQLTDVLRLIDKTIAETDEDQKMDLKEMFEVFPEIDEEMILAEKAEWGHTDQYAESTRRAQNYSKADWTRFKTEAEQVNADIEMLFKQQVAATDKRTVAAVNAARLLIDKWHFPCSKEFHVNLTEMTKDDERYRSNIEKNCSGLAQYIHDAAKTNLAN